MMAMVRADAVVHAARADGDDNEKPDQQDEFAHVRFPFYRCPRTRIVTPKWPCLWSW